MQLPKITLLGLSVVLAGKRAVWHRTKACTFPTPRGWACHQQSQPFTFVLGLGIRWLVDRHFVHINVFLIGICRRRMQDTGFM